MKKYAAIDIGTNSIRLLLAAIKENCRDKSCSGLTSDELLLDGGPISYDFIERKKYINTTRIGSSIDENKMISQKGIKKNVEAFCDFVQRAKEYGTEKISAVATSAVREAKNREEFIQAIYQKTGINIKIISGEEEAELGYKGVVMGMGCYPETDRKNGACEGSRFSANHENRTSTQSFLTEGPVPVVFPECRPDKDSVPRYRDGRPCPSSEAEGGRGLVPRCRGDLRHSGVGSSCVMHPNDTKGPSPCVILVIDIGGGSTELIIGTRQGEIKKTVSLDIGAVRMTEKFVTADSIGKKEHRKMETAVHRVIEEAKQEIISQIADCPAECHPEAGKTKGTHEGSRFSANQNGTELPSPCPTIGIGGTITALAALHQELDPYDPDRIHNYRLTFEDITNLKEKLLSLTVQQIKQLKGIHPKRADIIAAGITILSIIMESLSLKEITISEYDNLEGMLYDMI